MKLKLFITMVALLFIHGCNSGSSSVGEGETPINEVSDPDYTEVDNTDLDDSDIDDSNTDEPVTKVLAGWYIRTVAKATLSDGTEYIHRTAGIMGELKESQEGKDRHDIEAFGAPGLSVVFPQEDWEEENGDYFSDYRNFTRGETRQVWTFQVKNQGSVDLTDAALEITLEDFYDVYEVKKDGLTNYKEELAIDQDKKNTIILVDVDMQKEYSYTDLETAQLTMEGNVTRTFRWIVGGAATADDYEPLFIPDAIEQQTKTLSTRNKNEQIYDDKFGLPPQI